MNTSLWQSIALSLFSCLLLAACSGGDSNGDSDNPGPDANPDLRGTLYFPYAGGLASLSTKTGVLSTGHKHGQTVTRDGSEVVWLNKRPHNGGSTEEAIGFAKTDGTSVTDFVKVQYLSAPLAPSPDSSMIAAHWRPFGVSDPDGLYIFDRSGNVIRVYSDPSSSMRISSWAWIDNKQIVMTVGQHILYSPDVTQGGNDFVTSFGDNEEVDDIAVDASGTKLLFTKGNENSSNKHVFQLTVDANFKANANDAVQVTASNLNEMDPIWSPDGAKIAFRYGYDNTNAPDYNGQCPELHVVDGTAKQVSPTNKTQIQSYQNGEKRNTCAFGMVQWFDHSLPAINLGSSMATSKFNGDLSGHLFYYGSGMTRFDLNSGAEVSLAGEGYKPYPNAQGTEFVYEEKNPTSGSGVDQLTWRTVGGSQTDTFEKPDSIRGIPKLSPNGAYVAVEWDPDDPDVVTVFDRDGTFVRNFSDFQYWTWLPPSGRLILARHNQIFITDEALSNTTLLATLSGEVSDLDANQDGSKIAFAMMNQVWRINSDGSNLTQMTVGSETAFYPSWSRISDQLILQKDAGCDEVFAIPGNGERISTEENASKSVQLFRVTNSGSKKPLCIGDDSLASWRN